MLSKACRYAIRASLFLAAHSSPESKFGVKALAEPLHIPVHFLGKILQQMAREGLISSTKGPGGGFFLNEDNRKVNLKQIVLSIDGPDIMEGCILGFQECSSQNPCALHNLYGGYRNGFFNLLEDQTVEEVAEKIKRKNGSL